MHHLTACSARSRCLACASHAFLSRHLQENSGVAESLCGLCEGMGYAVQLLPGLLTTLGQEALPLRIKVATKFAQIGEMLCRVCITHIDLW